jgi:DNA-binding NarL/FixJ family response regulator
LPDINGKETFKRIKEYRPETPVVILTVNHDKKLVKEFLKEGIYGYLDKEADTVLQIKEIINSFIYKQMEKEQKKINRATYEIILYFLLQY